MELLHGMVPKLARLAVLWNPANPFSAPALESLKAAALTSNVQVVAAEVRTPEEIEKAFAGVVKDHAGAVTWITDGFLIQQRRQIAVLAARHRLPSVGGLREYAEAGGLMSYGPNREENYRRAAILVDKILRGAKPTDIPVEQPMKLELVLNNRTARALGITIPPDLLVLADRVIE
jgi:putative ABC transport system substrate-binding protein